MFDVSKIDLPSNERSAPNQSVLSGEPWNLPSPTARPSTTINRKKRERKKNTDEKKNGTKEGGGNNS